MHYVHEEVCLYLVREVTPSTFHHIFVIQTPTGWPTLTKEERGWTLDHNWNALVQEQVRKGLSEAKRPTSGKTIPFVDSFNALPHTKRSRLLQARTHRFLQRTRVVTPLAVWYRTFPCLRFTRLGYNLSDRLECGWPNTFLDMLSALTSVVVWLVKVGAFCDHNWGPLGTRYYRLPFQNASNKVDLSIVVARGRVELSNAK